MGLIEIRERRFWAIAIGASEMILTMARLLRRKARVTNRCRQARACLRRQAIVRFDQLRRASERRGIRALTVPPRRRRDARCSADDSAKSSRRLGEEFGRLRNSEERHAEREFDAQLQKGDNPGAWTCVVMDDVPDFGRTRRLVKICGVIHGEPFTGALMAQGDGTHRLPVKAALRKTIGKEAGATVHVRIDERIGYALPAPAARLAQASGRCAGSAGTRHLRVRRHASAARGRCAT